jgi:hypothetical protein
MKYIDWISSSRSVLIFTDSPQAEISKYRIYVDNILISDTNPNNTITNWYQFLADTYIPGRAIIKINNLNTGICYNITGTIFTDPTIEFWKPDFEASVLDKSISGGNWVNGVINNARDTATADIVIDGDRFMSPYYDFAPEEFVPGHTTDSVGIEVYTKQGETFATIVSGAIPIVANTITNYQISISQEVAAGFLVTYANKIFTRHTSTDFTSSTQFFIRGKNLILPPQLTSGYADYNMVKAGGTGLVYSNSVHVFITATNNFTILTSLMSLDDLQYVYVLDNGKEINQITTSSESGYMIERDWDKTSSTDTISQNYRAAVHFFNLPVGNHQLEAWFFDTLDVKFNRIFENFYTIDNTDTITLIRTPNTWQPFSDKAIVEIGLGLQSTTRKRLRPPHVSNYIIENNKNFFDLFDIPTDFPSGFFSASDIFVYANGQLLRSGFDYTLDLTSNKVITPFKFFPNGTYISITSTKYDANYNDWDYIISNNILKFRNIQAASSVRVLSFTAHEKFFMETERFVWNASRRFKFIRPILDDSYVWVYANGIPLVHRYDFIILDDFRTIELAERFTFENITELLVTSFKKPDAVNHVYGFRIFNDFYNRSSYKRLSRDHTTFLTNFLNQEDDKIEVFEDYRLSPANASKNIPSVALIDRERIEFFARGGGQLSDLRRGTLGTGVPYTSDPGTRVVDQGIQQTIPKAGDRIYTYTTVTTNTSTYIIPLFTFTNTGSYGITLDANVNLADQISVLYGGTPLHKAIRQVYINSTSSELINIGPDFYVSTSSLSTQIIVLNIGDRLQSGVRLDVIHRKGKIWTGTESLITSRVQQARFIRGKEADLPDTFFYSGDPRLLDYNFEPITTEYDKILRTE